MISQSFYFVGSEETLRRETTRIADEENKKHGQPIIWSSLDTDVFDSYLKAMIERNKESFSVLCWYFAPPLPRESLSEFLKLSYKEQYEYRLRMFSLRDIGRFSVEDNFLAILAGVKVNRLNVRTSDKKDWPKLYPVWKIIQTELERIGILRPEGDAINDGQPEQPAASGAVYSNLPPLNVGGANADWKSWPVTVDKATSASTFTNPATGEIVMAVRVARSATDWHQPDAAEDKGGPQPARAADVDKPVKLQLAPPGRPRDHAYDEAFELMSGGKSDKEAFELFCKNQNITSSDKSVRDAFKAAIKRRQNKT